MHTKVDHGKFLVEHKGTDYVFTVKDNQRTLRETLQALDESSFLPLSGLKWTRAMGGSNGGHRAQQLPLRP